MKLTEVLILSLSLALIVVGIHQTLTQGIGASYAIFMFAVGLLFWFQLRRNRRPESPHSPEKSPKSKKKR
jgi:Flp pilus assembly protein TadB